MRDEDDLRTTPELLSDVSSPRLFALWDGGNASYFLPRVGEVLVGRGERCQLRIEHSSVSREHARVLVAPTRIVDLGSSNGVRVRGERIPPHQPIPIAPGDVVELGAAVLVVQQPRAAERSDGALTRAAFHESSDAMRATERLLELVAHSDITVLLLGETGVGKNIAAARIHAGSRRAALPLVNINCAALPEALLEAELFGYERGAFTGATQSKPGHVEAADGGTLVLDEVGEMPLGTQAKILSVVETKQVTRLGSLTPRRVDVRFIAATNRDLEALVATRQFRQDLFYRLNGIAITIPPLRERRREIAQFVEAFVNEAATRLGRRPPQVSADALAHLTSYAWPGNLRELKNTMERALVLSAGGPIGIEHVAVSSARPSAAPPREGDSSNAANVTSSTGNLREDVEALERRRVLEALELHGGNQTRAAKALGLSRTALIARMEAFGLPRPRKK